MIHAHLAACVGSLHIRIAVHLQCCLLAAQQLAAVILKGAQTQFGTSLQQQQQQ
jgi:hypothetical protein